MVPLSSFFFSFLVYSNSEYTRALFFFFFFFFFLVRLTNELAIPICRRCNNHVTAAGCRTRSIKPTHHWQVVGTRFVQAGGRSLHPEVTGLPDRREILHSALGEVCFFIFFSFPFFFFLSFPRDRIPRVTEKRHSGEGVGGGWGRGRNLQSS